jgi:hypothetical protein
VQVVIVTDPDIFTPLLKKLPKCLAPYRMFQVVRREPTGRPSSMC